MSADVRGLNQARNNVNDGVSMTQVAQGALSEVQTGMQRLQELATQSANGTLTDTDRAALQAEAEQIQSQITSTLENTQYNGKSLLSADATVTLQLGQDEGDALDLATTDLTASLQNIDISTQAGAESALSTMQTNLATVSSEQGKLGAYENRLSAAASVLSTESVNYEASLARIQDADIASESANQLNSQVRQQAALSVLTQANQLSGQVYQLLQN
ncbi:putative flagellin domain-containing protein [Magnetofaba australis IT-1]|uniref:Flagellin n=2 Tax=Magnetofaba TaxID=1472292 RepID=A0A1Y2K9Z5_9PROT|nr:putative flagellin domain-containing protein [Magnetofaba australis IT-1]